MALKGRLAWRALVTVGSGCKRLDDRIDDKCFLWQKGIKFRCIVFIRSFRIVFPSLVRVCAGPCTGLKMLLHFVNREEYCVFTIHSDGFSGWDI